MKTNSAVAFWYCTFHF